jgi:hypothetical protein
MKTLISIGSIAIGSIALNLMPVQQAQAVDLSLTSDIPFTTSATTEALYGGLGWNGAPTIASKTFGDWTSEGYNFLLPNGNALSTPNTAAVEDGSSMHFYGTSLSAPVGNSYIAADGAYLVGRIYQDLTGLEIGQMYSVSFYQAAAQQNGLSGNTTDAWIVNVGGNYETPTYSADDSDGAVNYGTTVTGGVFTGGTTYESPTMSLVSQAAAGTQTTTTGNPTVSGWQQDSFTFTAGAETQTLSFLAKGTPNGKPPFALLAGVSAAKKIPEPDTYVGTLLGLGILGTVVKSRLGKKKLDDRN